MGREFELKFRAEEAQLKAVEAAFGGFRVIGMETTYYDAPDGILGRLHWTLRRRMENGRAVCTLKSDLPDGSRGEWEVEGGDILEAVPRLIALGAPAALGEFTAGGVLPTCGARFTRKAALLSAGEGTVELALGQGVLLGGGQELPFGEIEVELKQGKDEDALTFAGALAAQYHLIPEPRSKIRRALSLAARAMPADNSAQT